MSNTFLSNLLFSKSTGTTDGDDDKAFNDAIDYGKFPNEMKITGIKRIDIFSDKSVVEDDADAYITGIIVYYDGYAKPITHGLVGENNKLKSLTFDTKKHILVGAYGRLKASENEKANNRIGCIGFVQLDTITGKADIKGFYGSTDNLAASWASFGPIIALQGTTKEGIGITTLGFVKTLGDTPGGIHITEQHGKSSAHSL